MQQNNNKQMTGTDDNYQLFCLLTKILNVYISLICPKIYVIVSE